MAFNVVLVLAICCKLVSGLAYDGPKATLFARGWEFNGLGWSPAPTSAPISPHELIKRGDIQGRQLASTILAGSDQTCGYLSGSAGAVYTCGSPSSTCNLLPAVSSNSYGAIACCADGQCYGRLFCVNSADYYSSSACNDVCQANTFTLKCTYTDAPYCNTAVWANPRVSDVYCAARSVSTPQTIYTTYSGQTIGGTFVPVALDETSTTSSSSRRTTSFSSSFTSDDIEFTTSTSPPTPTPIPPNPGKPTPVGAIVGGVVGGLALLAAIAFGIFFVRRKNNKDKANTVAGVAGGHGGAGSQAPPVYIPPQSEMDGVSANKNPMLQGYYAPGVAGAQSHPYQQNQDALSNDGGYGTYDSKRRESALTPISPQTHQSGSVGGSPNMRESYATTGHVSYPPPPPGSQEIGTGAPPTTYEMAGTPIHR